MLFRKISIFQILQMNTIATVFFLTLRKHQSMSLCYRKIAPLCVCVSKKASHSEMKQKTTCTDFFAFVPIFLSKFYLFQVFFPQNFEFHHVKNDSLTEYLQLFVAFKCQWFLLCNQQQIAHPFFVCVFRFNVLR